VLHGVLTRSSVRPRSAPRAAYDASAAAGSARTTRAARPGSPSSARRCSRVRWRSRLFTRLRVAALPTALLTVNPTWTGPGSASGSTQRWSTIGAARASPTAHSAAEAVTVGEAMDSGEHGGCRELWPSDRQALAALAATAGQDRATGTGPHAQTETVHLVTATVVRLVGTLAHGYFSEGFEGCPLHCEVSAGCSAGTAHPRGRPVADRGRAAPVDMERPANGTRWGKRGSNPREPPAGPPVDDVLPETSRGCYVPPLHRR